MRDTCTPMFIAALFTITRTWKQPRCPSPDEWIRNLWYTYTMEYYPAIEKNTFTFHFHALEKEMATHSSVLAWRIPGMGEPGGLPSMGSYRVGHD